MTENQPSRGERVACWIGNAIAIAYLAWLAAALSWINPKYAGMYESMAVQLPRATAFVIGHATWLYPSLFGILAAAVLGKDLLFRDKRLSVVIAFVITIAAQFIAHAFMLLYFLPMFGLMDQLSGQPLP